MNNLYRYIVNEIPLKLNEEQRNRLLELDAEYGKLYKEWWYKWDRTESITGAS